MFWSKAVLKICSKFNREHPRRGVISIKLLCNFIEITLWHGYSPVNLLHIFRTPFSKKISGRLPIREIFSQKAPSWVLDKVLNIQKLCKRLVCHFHKFVSDRCLSLKLPNLLFIRFNIFKKKVLRYQLTTIFAKLFLYVVLTYVV